MNEVARRCFEKGYFSFKGKSNLGDLAFKAVLYLTQEENIIDLLAEGVEMHYIPLLNVHGQIEEKYLQLNNRFPVLSPGDPE